MNDHDDSVRAAEGERPLGGAHDPDEASAALALATCFGLAPREILVHLLDGDPLGLRRRGAKRVQESALLLCPDRLFLHVVARAAYEGFYYRGEPPIGEWIARCVERSIEEILEEDRQLARRDDVIEFGHHYRILIELFRVSPRTARLMYVAFNDLPELARRAFLGFLRDERSIEQLAADLGRTEAVVREQVALALTVLTPDGDGWVPGRTEETA